MQTCLSLPLYSRDSEFCFNLLSHLKAGQPKSPLLGTNTRVAAATCMSFSNGCVEYGPLGTQCPHPPWVWLWARGCILVSPWFTAYTLGVFPVDERLGTPCLRIRGMGPDCNMCLCDEWQPFWVNRWGAGEGSNRQSILNTTNSKWIATEGKKVKKDDGI